MTSFTRLHSPKAPVITVIALLFLFIHLPTTALSKPALLLLKTWQPSQDISGWLMSEKLDGVRARWDGQQLISRGGHLFAAPKWFTNGFPPFALDGELWSKRGDFERIVSIVRRKRPHHGWNELTYQIFELPGQHGGLAQRLTILSRYLSTHSAPYLHIIKQLPCKDKHHMQQYLHALTRLGAEGLVVRNPTSPYQNGRSSNALKVKKSEDAECSIVAYKAGKGKLTDLTGALMCRLHNGQIISIGSGLNHQLRTTPPPIGKIITFKYYGLTKRGKPRHPVYLRLWRKDIM
ncbi:MAG: DNA ligase [Mariprofundus sp.]|nr:DNA ligase [Mariprofundus sp.]